VEEGVLETQPTKYLDCMKNIVFTVLPLVRIALFFNSKRIAESHLLWSTDLRT